MVDGLLVFAWSCVGLIVWLVCVMAGVFLNYVIVICMFLWLFACVCVVACLFACLLACFLAYSFLCVLCCFVG